MLFITSIAVDRTRVQRAIRRLEPDERLRLLDAFTDRSPLRYLPIIALLVIFVGVSQLYPQATDLVLWVFWLGLAVYAGLSVLLDGRRLRGLDLPGHYMRTWLQGRTLTAVGFGLLVAGYWLAR